MESLGIDLRLLLVQIINFLLLFLLLKKWVYPPFIRFLDERAQRIKESLAASEKMRAELKSFEGEKAAALAKIRERSQALLDDARQEAKIEKEKILDEARWKAGRIIEEAAEQITREKEKSQRAVRAEVAALSLTLTRKALGSLDTAAAHRLIEEALKKSDDPEIGQAVKNN